MTESSNSPPESLPPRAPAEQQGDGLEESRGLSREHDQQSRQRDPGDVSITIDQPDQADPSDEAPLQSDRQNSDPYAKTVISTAHSAGQSTDADQASSGPGATDQQSEKADTTQKSAIDTDLYNGLPVQSSADEIDPTQPPPTSFRAEPSETTEGDSPETESSVDRYEFLEEVARGGLGKIWKARDKHVRRVVAIKELLGRYRRHPSTRERFREEAQITGQLEHPSIVPIYDIGRKENGSAFYSMKLVHGTELHKAIEEFHMLPPGSSAWLVARNNLLRNFVAICNAVAFAHDRGVLHRDLKPQNVMLGEYGETLLLDWGLAKLLDSPETVVHGRSEVRSADTTITGTSSKPGISSDARSAASQTRMGSVLGTLSYMPPEQAAGRLDELDTRCDIYSLGAILYHLLTGRPPIPRGEFTEMVQHVLTGNITPPREVDPAIPKPLEAVTLKALSSNKEDRYQTALQLAEEIDNFLADEPVSAFAEPWHWKLARWLKRHRTFATTTAAVLLILGAGGIFWRAYEQGRLEEVRSAVQDKYAAAQEAESNGALVDAGLLYREALGKLRGEPSFAALAEEIQTESDRVERLVENQTQIQRARDNYEGFLAEADVARSHGWLVASEVSPDDYRSAVTNARQALERYDLINSPTLQPPPSHLTSDEIDRIRQVGFELTIMVANFELDRAWSQDGDVKAAAESLLKWTDLAMHFEHQTPAFYLFRAAAFEVLDRQQELRDAVAKAAALEPVTALDFFLQGFAELQRRKNLQAAAENFQKALNLDPANYWALHCLGGCQLKLGKRDGAADTFTACIALRPDYPWAYITRGAAYFESGKDLLALADFNRAQQLDPNIYAIYVNRSRVHLNQAIAATDPQEKAGHFAAGQKDLAKAIAMQPKLAAAHINLAEFHRRQQQIDEALAELSLAIELAPRSPRPYRFRALIHLQSEKPDPALADFQRAVELETSPAAKAEDLRQIGSLHYRAGDFPAALAKYDEALKLIPSNGDLLRLRAETLLKLDRFDDAIESYNSYLKQGPPLADVYRGRASAYAKLGKYREALSDYTRALELEPSTNMLTRRGWALLLQSRQLAVEDFEEAIRLRPDNPDSYNGRGYARVLLGDYTAGIADAEEAFKRHGDAWQVSYNAATIYGQAVAQLRADTARSDEDRRRLEQEYIARAVHFLETARKSSQAQDVSKLLKTIETDEALDPIRETPQFREMLPNLRADQ